jgi:hypothetical protein
MQKRCVKRLKVAGREVCTARPGFPINGTMPSDTLTLWTFARQAYAAPRPSNEESGRQNGHRDGCRISILSALDDDIVSDVSQCFVMQITALHAINLCQWSACW